MGCAGAKEAYRVETTKKVAPCDVKVHFERGPTCTTHGCVRVSGNGKVDETCCRTCSEPSGATYWPVRNENLCHVLLDHAKAGRWDTVKSMLEQYPVLFGMECPGRGLCCTRRLLGTEWT